VREGRVRVRWMRVKWMIGEMDEVEKGEGEMGDR